MTKIMCLLSGIVLFCAPAMRGMQKFADTFALPDADFSIKLKAAIKKGFDRGLDCAPCSAGCKITPLPAWAKGDGREFDFNCMVTRFRWGSCASPVPVKAELLLQSAEFATQDFVRRRMLRGYGHGAADESIKKDFLAAYEAEVAGKKILS